MSRINPEVQLHFDMDYLGRNNFTLANLSGALATFGREYSSGATFRQGTENYDIIIKYSGEEQSITRFRKKPSTTLNISR